MTTDNEELRLASAYVTQTRCHVFLTGKAGTGKTTFLRNIQSATRKRTVVVAPTGVAAINAGGATIHSFFQIAPGMHLPGTDVKRTDRNRFSLNSVKQRLIRTIDLLIIDEVSMVRADLLDAVDEVLRRVRHSSQPFGGVQLLLIGDMQQLAPVTTPEEWQELRHYYRTPYFFDSRALSSTSYVTIELSHVFRQTEQTFVDLLNRVRDNRLDAASLALLNGRYRPNFDPPEGYITLTTHNYQAQRVNRSRLDALPTASRWYAAQVEGDFPESSYPTEASLELKKGAQVMFCKNDPSPEKRFYNGLIGQVVGLTDEQVSVRCGSQVIDVAALTWQNTKYEVSREGVISEQVTGVFRQIPLRPAWAITVHKSQGLTFDHVVINVERAFSFGQVYVALSRCRTLDGIVLSSPISEQAILNDPDIVRFNQYVTTNRPDEQRLRHDVDTAWLTTLCSLFDFTQLQLYSDQYVRLAEEHLWKTYPKYTQSVKQAAAELQSEVTAVGQRFCTQLQQLAGLEGVGEHDLLEERYRKACRYFTERLPQVLAPVADGRLPNVDNQAQRERLRRQLDLFTTEYSLRMTFFRHMPEQFSPERYWDVKAAFINHQDAPEPQRRSRPAESHRNAERVEATEDVLNPLFYERLKAWRVQTAARQHLKPFQVLTNTTLLTIANIQPTTTAQLSRIKGMGSAKLAAYGNELLALCQKNRE